MLLWRAMPGLLSVAPCMKGLSYKVVTFHDSLSRVSLWRA